MVEDRDGFFSATELTIDHALYHQIVPTLPWIESYRFVRGCEGFRWPPSHKQGVREGKIAPGIIRRGGDHALQLRNLGSRRILVAQASISLSEMCVSRRICWVKSLPRLQRRDGLIPA